MERIIGETQEINKLLKRLISSNGDWFTASLPAVLNELSEFRNPAAHFRSLDRETVHRLRNKYLGVGCEGELVKLAKVRVP